MSPLVLTSNGSLGLAEGSGKPSLRGKKDAKSLLPTRGDESFEVPSLPCSKGQLLLQDQHQAVDKLSTFFQQQESLQTLQALTGRAVNA